MGNNSYILKDTYIKYISLANYFEASLQLVNQLDTFYLYRLTHFDGIEQHFYLITKESKVFIS